MLASADTFMGMILTSFADGRMLYGKFNNVSMAGGILRSENYFESSLIMMN